MSFPDSWIAASCNVFLLRILYFQKEFWLKTFSWYVFGSKVWQNLYWEYINQKLCAVQLICQGINPKFLYKLSGWFGVGVGMLLYMLLCAHDNSNEEGKPTFLSMSCHPSGPTMATHPLPGMGSHAGIRKGYPLSLTCFFCGRFSYFLFFSCRLLFSFSWKILHTGIFNFVIRTTTPLSPNQRPLPPSPRGDEGGRGEVSKNIISVPYLPQ